ncbi:hypothetical protein PV11_05160 [Exophiala sideris]|uniref:RNA helicase n=1 Tax=Exophiala sideris TaxID=1016849 RepID=A0A0D1X5Z0_9EURO|nr:hypothetical protein PV11_05160 [Exophiala sideris]
MASSSGSPRRRSLLEGGKPARKTPPSTFQDLGIDELLSVACTSLGYRTPTPIQEQAIPPALAGRDLIALAETGSGKTVAYLLPILHHLFDHPQPLHSLILAPTRELALQITKVVEGLVAARSVLCVSLIGGVPRILQAMALGKKPHIIVATPGRLVDHLENTKGFSLRQLRYFVIDEADRLLDDLDFGPELSIILKLLSPNRRTYLFSATMSGKVEALQRAALSNPRRMSVSSKMQTVATLLQSFLLIPHQHKDLYLAKLLDELTGRNGIIFTRTIEEAQRLFFMLQRLGLSAVALHGDLTQTAREKALDQFRSKSRRLLVATDIAARGLDIDSVDVVVNYDLPGDSRTYIHRVGRTARAGKSGRAFSFVTQYDIELLVRIEETLGQKLEEHVVAKVEVMRHSLRVNDAQRVAAQKMKELY